MRARRHRTWVLLAAAGLFASGAGAVHAQSANAAQQQVQAHHLKDQLQSSSLHEQQRQQTSSTLQKAFKDSQSASQTQSADNAQYDRYRDNQRNRVNDATSTPSPDRAQKLHDAQPAHASSGH